MASVSSLDKDLRKLRLDKYTPGAANEARTWIEGILGERLPSGDLLEGLKDGTVLCRLVNLALPPPGIRYKDSAMPFVQMENISHFLSACKMPPLNLQEHDMFLTVDLYEQKDPAQVLQCLGAFSRAANLASPANFASAIGPKRVSPQHTGPGAVSPPRGRGMSAASNTSSIYGTPRPVLAPHKTGDSASGRWSPTKSPTKSPNGNTSPPVSGWSRKDLEGATAPAWNIAQYGYMGGASQGNLGISFGGRRQITSAGPYVPNLADKERMRKEQEAEEERQRQLAEEEERQQKAEQEAEEARARLEEERRWEEETRRQRDTERRKAEEERRRWEEEERQWKLTEEKRRKEEQEAEARLEEERKRARSRTRSNSRLRGQYLSEYQAEQEPSRENSNNSGYGDRIKELEKELELARQREQEYERERQERSRRPVPSADAKARARSRSRPRPPSRQDSWSKDEREVLRTQWNQQQQKHQQGPPPRSQPQHPQQPPQYSQQQRPYSPQPPPPAPARSPRPLPDPAAVATPPPKVKTHRTGDGSSSPTKTPRIKTHRTGDGPNKLAKHRTGDPSPTRLQAQHTGGSSSASSRPLPDPAAYSSPPRPAPPLSPARLPRPRQAPPQAHQNHGARAPRTLLEREMEMERQRQREWEDAQRDTAARAARTPSGQGVDGIGGGVDGRWDVSQWTGYTGGDNQNRGAQGIGSGRRQIAGPRPLPGPGR